MRDRRFVAVHRGGPLDKPSHVFLARWAADCAEEVLHLFQQHSTDERPEKAIEIVRNWASGSVKTGVAMKASLASHTAARETKEKAAIAAARAAGQAVATAHCADHSMGALLYAVKAMEAAGLDPESVLQKRLAKLPDHLREQVTSGINIRLKNWESTRIRNNEWPAAKTKVAEQSVGHGAADRAALAWILLLPRPGLCGRSVTEGTLSL